MEMTMRWYGKDHDTVTLEQDPSELLCKGDHHNSVRQNAR